MRKKRQYPSNWAEISRHIRYDRGGGQCECWGECGLHQTHPGPRRCVERDRQPAVWANGIVILTVAHLCHNSKCDNLEHLRAMCNRCHLRYDSEFHQKNAAETRRLKVEAMGQLSFFWIAG